MQPDDATIKARLEEVLQSVVCPVSGCWGLHGAHYEYYHDEGCECYVLEVWPVAFDAPRQEGGNGQNNEDVLCYEFAEFEFSETITLVALEHLHFSQRREIFKTGRKEEGQDLELRVHLVPQEIDEI
ncbi:MAG: hypothetical protein FJ276_02870 [Planctomycetes bacterium]|nr:hypothetical protein [Planctomycetota bacterium]